MELIISVSEKRIFIFSVLFFFFFWKTREFILKRTVKVNLGVALLRGGPEKTEAK